MLKAFSYCRYSSDMQREESIEAQTAAIQEYAEKHGIVIVQNYVDRGISGKSAESREQFLQMVKDAREKHYEDVSLVLVHKSNRFARNREESAIYKHKLRKCGIQVKAVAQDYGEGPHTVLIEALMEGLDEYYSLELATEIMKGLMVNASKCKFTGGKVLYGYKVNEEKRFEIEPKEAVVVQDIYKKFIAGWSYPEILEYLQASGIKTRAGKNFSKSAIYEMLRNERYAGVYLFNEKKRRGPNGKRTSRLPNDKESIVRIEGGMPAIIPRSWWEKAQDILDGRKNQKQMTPRTSRQYLLTGFMYCGQCGGAYVGRTSLTKYTAAGYYSCAARRSRRDCDNPHVKQAETEQAALSFLAKTIDLIDPATLAEEVNKNLAEEQGEGAEKRKRLEGEIAAIDKKLSNLIDALEVSGISEQIQRRIDEHNQEKKNLLRSLAQLSPEIQQITPEAIAAVKGSLDPRGKPYAEIREIMRKLNFSIVIHPDGYAIRNIGDGGVINGGAEGALRTIITLFCKNNVYHDISTP